MNKRITNNRIYDINEQEVFVFGSNTQGLHAGGAANLAFMHFGALMGQSEGLQGRSYAINSMSGLNVLYEQVKRFIQFASENPKLTFLVTEIGCGIAGYTPEKIAPLFKECISINNIHLPQRFWEVLKNNAKL